MKLYTYLNVDGNCRQAFEFYAQPLGGTIAFCRRTANRPAPSRRRR